LKEYNKASRCAIETGSTAKDLYVKALQADLFERIRLCFGFRLFIFVGFIPKSNSNEEKGVLGFVDAVLELLTFECKSRLMGAFGPSWRMVSKQTSERFS
jgi:hypothetical protein